MKTDQLSESGEALKATVRLQRSHCRSAVIPNWIPNCLSNEGSQMAGRHNKAGPDCARNMPFPVFMVSLLGMKLIEINTEVESNPVFPNKLDV